VIFMSVIPVIVQLLFSLLCTIDQKQTTLEIISYYE